MEYIDTVGERKVEEDCKQAEGSLYHFGHNGQGTNYKYV